jgi:hypothetical protein
VLHDSGTYVKFTQGENAREQRMRRILFSLFLFRLRLPVLFFSYST